MGLLDSLTTLASGTLGKDAGLLQIAARQLAAYPGGIPGLIAAFQKGGLGEIVQSWIGQGPNQPISGQQLDSVLAPQVDAIAAESGQDRSSVLDTLAGLLPQLVDSATPDGQAPSSGSLDAGSLLRMLSSFQAR